MASHPSSRLVGVRLAARRRDAHRATRALLVSAGSGWSLMTPSGATLVSGTGPGGRRRCLEFARAHGILAVLS